MSVTTNALEQRIKTLQQHLELENPVLLNTIKSFRDLDKVAYRMGLLQKDQSFAMQIPWWPLVAILGTFSAGKSTFINYFLQHKLQRTGNQAVDDRFTVLCYSKQQTPHALPGVALDSDPRFPFYQISQDIEKVSAGEGQRIDAYLQLKTCPSEPLKGKILIDSPGFDADAQRTSTLRITDHIVHLADLVLVFFDARHPEPGAMQDTLRHLVASTINRSDSGKFLYILNQIDTTAREDNPEEVVAAWQRALGEQGLTAGRFYTIYNPEAATPIDNEALRERFERKRDADLGEIHGRIKQVEIERAYRIVATLEKTSREIEHKAVPFLQHAIQRWKTRTLWGDVVGLGILGAAATWITMNFNLLHAEPTIQYGAIGLVAAWALTIHFGMRELAARSLLPQLKQDAEKLGILGNLTLAFKKNTRAWRSIFASQPAGWRGSSMRLLSQVSVDTEHYVQTLNDTFTNPSGDRSSLSDSVENVDDFQSSNAQTAR